MVPGPRISRRPVRPGWSASYRKSYLCAVKYLYKHFQAEEDLPDHNPAVLEIAPKVVYKRGYSLTKEEVRRLLDGEGRPKGRLLAHWTFYAPSRLKTFSDARWPEIDLDAATWEVVGKGGKVDVFALHPALVREFRAYRRWQLSEAQRNPAMRDALANPETAYVLLTKNGKRTHPNTVGKMLKRYAARNGVGVQQVEKAWDMPKGVTSLVSPHAMRRTWATLALNDEDDPQPIDALIWPLPLIGQRLPRSAPPPPLRPPSRLQAPRRYRRWCSKSGRPRRARSSRSTMPRPPISLQALFDSFSIVREGIESLCRARAAASVLEDAGAWLGSAQFGETLLRRAFVRLVRHRATVPPPRMTSGSSCAIDRAS